MYDVVIIGAGVMGCSIAKALSKYELKMAVLEKGLDVCEGTSKANSGICHAGYDAKTGTLKAKLNVRGSKMMEELSEEMGFLYRRCGSMVLCFDENDRGQLQTLKDRGDANGVENLQIISGDEARAMEPSLNENVVAALLAPTGAIIDPFGLTIAMANNAAVNGTEFIFGAEVTDICPSASDNGYTLSTSKGEFEAKVVINAAGVYADAIHNMVTDEKMEIVPRRGEYMLLDTTAGDYVSHTIFQLPTKLGKGILITPTVHGNLLVGPTADDIEDKEGTETTQGGLNTVKEKAVLSASTVPFKEVITSFAGLRAKATGKVSLNNFEKEQKEDDFLIGEVPGAKGFIDVAGMESPGLSSAPAVGEYVCELVSKCISLSEKTEIKVWKANKSFAVSSFEERRKMIEADPLNGTVICRCCTVTEGEIVEAIHQPVGAKTSDGVKRRTGAGMGRCQAGFCNPKVVEILARELDIPASEVLKSSDGSNFLV